MYQKIINEICNELNIKYTYLSKNWIIKLEKNNTIKYLSGDKFDLNGHALGNLLDDKYAFYDTLKNLNIPVCEHKIFYRKNNYNDYAKDCNTYESIYKCFKEYKENVVVKINNGSLGMDVYHITNKNELTKTIDKLFMENYSLSICPFYNIKNEYRIIILKNKIKLIFKKQKPVVIGNGINTIRELLIKLNEEYFKNKKLPDIILKKNEEYVYDWRFNLSKGATATTEIDNDLKEKLSRLALEVTKKVGITFASIDIVELENNNLLVLEANSGVTIDKITNFIYDGYNIAKSIYKEAIILLMKE